MVASAALGLGLFLVMVACQTIIANGRDSERRDARFANFTLVLTVRRPALGGLLLGDGGSPDGSEPLCWGRFRRRPACWPSWPWRRPSRSSTGQARRQTPRPLRITVIGCDAECPARSDCRGGAGGASVCSPSADLLVAFLPAYEQVHGLSPRLVGLLIAAHGLASIAIRLCMMQLVRQVHQTRPARDVSPRRRRRSVPDPDHVFHHGELLVLMLMTGAGIGLCQPIAISWVAGAVQPGVRGTAMSVRMAGNRLGQTVVPLASAFSRLARLESPPPSSARLRSCSSQRCWSWLEAEQATGTGTDSACAPQDETR